jgi:muconolactone delta-isomerase
VPTWGETERFRADFDGLSPEARRRFRAAVAKFVEDLRRDGRFRKGLRVKGVQAAPGVFEMTWAPDGRATFEFAEPAVEGETHIIWRRVGTHDVLGAP